MDVAGQPGLGDGGPPESSHDGGGEGPQDPEDGCRSRGPPADGGACHSGTHADEGLRDNSRSHEGPRGTRTSTEGLCHTGISAEGPRDNARSHEGPRDTRSHEGPHCTRTGPIEGSCHSGTRLDEGPHCTRSHEGPRDNSRSHEGPHHTRTRHDEGPCHTRTSPIEESKLTEGPQDNARSHEGPRCTRTGSIEESKLTEGPRCTRTGSIEGTRLPKGPRCIDKGPGDESRSDEIPSRAGTDEGPRHTRTTGNDETPRHTGTSVDEGPRRTPFTIEGPGDDSRSHETPACTHEVSEGPVYPRDITAEQRDAGAPDSDPGPRREGHAPGTPCDGDPSSFKKPVAPGRLGGHEKGLDPRSKPRPPGPHGEAAPHVGAGLPSPAVPYREPPWSGLPQALYSLEVLKGGAILSTKDLSRAAWTVFGRLPACHVPLEHPSVSRFHAVLQYRAIPGDGSAPSDGSTPSDEPDQERGFYLYDLGSTHGTFLNKQRIPPKCYRRVRVGHVMKFGGSTRLFILQGPAEDEEAESELTVTQIKEARRQKEDLQKRMLGDDSDEEEEPPEEGKKPQATTGAEAGCMWGMGEDAIEEESEENPIAMEFQEEREASYIKNPKKALQGFFDREGEELEFEYEERSPGSWLCRIKLPADDCGGKQLVAEVTHSGKKKEAANICCLEACRMLEMRGLLRQEAVSRKRKSKKWEDEDYYDSDDDTFLDRTGMVEKKRLNRMKKAGKIEEKPDTMETLSAKLELVEKEMADVAAKLKTSHTDVTQVSSQDSLDAFMTEMRAGKSVDGVSRKKLHLQSLELRKEQQRLRSLIKIVQPAKLPDLLATPATPDPKPKALHLPMFGAMKGGSKFKLKTGTVGRLPPKRTDLPASLFTMKDTDEPEEEEEEEDEDDEPMMVQHAADGCSEEGSAAAAEPAKNLPKMDPPPQTQTSGAEEAQKTRSPERRPQVPECSARPRPHIGQEKPETSADEKLKPGAERQKKTPSKPPRGVSTAYPEDDPDYCVWTPPAGQSGDGKTHLNDKYGY